MITSIAKSETKYPNAPTAVSADKIGVLDRLFGCWHRNVSRPFTYDDASYCVCLDCGARKNFDAATLRTYGSFHYAPPPASNCLSA